MSNEVFITGLGMVTPAGIGTTASWQGLLAGEHYVQRAPHLDFAGCVTDFCAQVQDFVPPPGTEHRDRVCQFAVAAAEEAVANAGLVRPASPTRGGVTPQEHRGWPNSLELGSRSIVSVGTSKGGILAFTHLAPLLTDCRQGRLVPGSQGLDSFRNLLGSIPPDGPARCISQRLGITGGVHATVAACSTGTLAVIRAARFIEDGEADVVLAGSTDASLHKLWLAAFERMGILAPEHPARGPGWVCRPFDSSRAGLALGEGAAVLVMESGVSVRRRGIRPMARLAGAAAGTDPAGLAQISLAAEPLAQVIRLACERARVGPADITCVHAHGTGTLTNDLAEVRALRAALGDRAATVPIASIKGAIGHLLGGAGAVELAVTALTCREGVSPGTATLIELDPELAPLNVPSRAFEVARGPILKTSLGFGGHVAAVVLTPV